MVDGMDDYGGYIGGGGYDTGLLAAPLYNPTSAGVVNDRPSLLLGEGNWCIQQGEMELHLLLI
jgi:hypothetical protein